MAITDSQSVQIGSTQSEPQAVGCNGGKKVKVEHLFAIGLYATIIISRTFLRLGDAN